ncbi:MAG TPA: hypothetical protein VEK80_13710, partial [Kribbellaceae bacterium]|nr:hypothetical protein [Kribbellaceae bacterium]
MRSLDDALREVVGEVADWAQPVNLGVRALATARRRQRAKRTWTVAGAAAAVVAVVVIAAILSGGPWLASLPRPASSTPPAPVPTAAPVPLTFDHRVLLTVEDMDLVAYQGRHAGDGIAVVYSRAHQRYEEVLYAEEAMPAPAGDVAVLDGRDLPPVTVVDLSTLDHRRWAVNAYLVSDPQWSPDGGQVLVSINDKNQNRNGFALIDPATGKAVNHWIDERFDSYRYRFTWHPDGRHVLLALADRTNASESEPDKVAALQLFTLDGQPDGQIPVRGSVDGLSSWSPDGRYVIADGVVDRDGSRVNQRAVFEVATGRTVTPLFPDGQAWWIDNGRILLAHYERDV